MAKANIYTGTGKRGKEQSTLGRSYPENAAMGIANHGVQFGFAVRGLPMHLGHVHLWFTMPNFSLFAYICQFNKKICFLLSTKTLIHKQEQEC
ncbi:MAG: hypothetical protein HC896_13420 [Bacteroidales bacterium]|nr:hypothetical protein [Bacteroidales bacterium]